MFCTSCGNQNKSGSKYCVKCGTKLDNQAKVQENHNNFTYRNISSYKLGDSPDFYTYLSAGTNVLAWFTWNLLPMLSLLLSIVAVVSAIVGFKRTTNRTLHTIVFLIAIIVFIVNFSSASYR